MADALWMELTRGLSPGPAGAVVGLRLVVACLLGGLVGLQRQRAGKPAGLRTHMLVGLGTCVFVLAARGVGMPLEATSRIIQGVATGIGFIGTGAILKLDAEHHIRGLTTAAGLWLTAAAGVAVGLGAVGVALLATALTLVILSWVKWLERRPWFTAAPEPPPAVEGARPGPAGTGPGPGAGPSL